MTRKIKCVALTFILTILSFLGQTSFAKLANYILNFEQICQQQKLNVRLDESQRKPLLVTMRSMISDAYIYKDKDDIKTLAAEFFQIAEKIEDKCVFALFTKFFFISLDDKHASFSYKTSFLDFYETKPGQSWGLITDQVQHNQFKIRKVLGGQLHKDIVFNVGDRIVLDEIFSFMNSRWFTSTNFFSLSGKIIDSEGQIRDFVLQPKVLQTSVEPSLDVSWYNKENGLIFVKIQSFNKKNLSDEFQFAIEKISENNPTAIKGIVFDLRYNSGGDLGSTINLLGHFFIGIIEEMKSYFFGNKTYYSNIKELYFPLQSAKIVVIVNSHTQSAAQIFAYILKVNRLAIVVGDQFTWNIEGNIAFDLDKDFFVLLPVGKAYINKKDLEDQVFTPDCQVDANDELLVKQCIDQYFQGAK
jgi:Peptidase family S41